MKILVSAMGTLAVAVAVGSTAVVAQSTDYERAGRELNIMSHIFQTAFEEGSSEQRFVYRQGPEALYLAGQGMVFTFNLAGMRNFWSSSGMGPKEWADFSRSMSQFAQEVVQEVNASFPDLEFDFDYDYDYDYDFDGAAGAAQQQLSAAQQQLSATQRETMAQMNEAMREQQRAVQEIQRQVRNLQRELRGKPASGDSTEARITEQEEKLQAELEELQRQQQAYGSFMEEVASKTREQQEVFNRQLTARVVQALCDYGSTLKSLQPDEHITLVFENYLDDKDQILVFPFAAVSNCTSGEQLQQAGVSYRM